MSGSLRAASTNSALLAALRANAPSDCRLTIYDGLGHLPIFNPDDEGERTPPQATSLIDAVTRADGIIVSCPEYAHGVPGGLKNALDWLVSRGCRRRQAGNAGSRLATLADFAGRARRDHSRCSRSILIGPH